jgi:hypothetical protein
MVPDGLSGKVRGYRLACNLTAGEEQSRTRMGVKPREESRAGAHQRIKGCAASHSARLALAVSLAVCSP